MPEVEYRGRTIEPQPYQSIGGQSRGKAMVHTHDGGSVRTSPVFAPLDKTFSTEQEAAAYAVEMAKKWIDDLEWNVGPLRHGAAPDALDHHTGTTVTTDRL